MDYLLSTYFLIESILLSIAYIFETGVKLQDYKTSLSNGHVNLDVMLVRRKMSLTELSEKVGITMANLSIP